MQSVYIHIHIFLNWNSFLFSYRCVLVLILCHVFVFQVFPLLVASLKLETSTPVVLSTMKAFTEMLQNSNEETNKKLVEYSYDIVPQLVKLAGFTGNMASVLQ